MINKQKAVSVKHQVMVSAREKGKIGRRMGWGRVSIFTGVGQKCPLWSGVFGAESKGNERRNHAGILERGIPGSEDSGGKGPKLGICLNI